MAVPDLVEYIIGMIFEHPDADWRRPYSFEAERCAIVHHRRTLRSCALVSRVWASLARRHLSSSIVLSPRNAERISTALRLGLLHVEWVRTLVIDTAPHDWQPQPAHALAEQLVERCPNLRRIAVSNVSAIPQSTSCTVTELGVSEASLHDVTGVVRGFRDISVGQLLGAETNVDEGPVVDRLDLCFTNAWRDHARFLPSAHWLCLRNAHICSLAALSTVQQLRHLYLPRLALVREDASFVLDLLRCLWPTVETIALTWTDRSDSAPLEFIDQLVADLGQAQIAPRLRRLTVPCLYSPFVGAPFQLIDMQPLADVCEARNISLVQLVRLD